MEDINLHFTGDFHAIGAANNLLAALIDNHVYWGNKLDIDTRRVTWRRAVDMNDRALRDIVTSLGGAANGLSARSRLRHHRGVGSHGDLLPRIRPRRSPASARPDPDRPDARQESRHRQGPLGRRLDGGAAQGRARAEPRADAREQPGLHPWRPVRQHRPWLQLGDRHQGRAQARRLCGDRGGLRRRSRRREVLRHQMPQSRAQAAIAWFWSPPSARSRCMAAWPRTTSRRRTSSALEKGFANLERHVENLRQIRRAGGGVGQPLLERHRRRDRAAQAAVRARSASNACMADHWAQGGAGAVELANTVVRTIETKPSDFQPLYPDDMSLWDKTRTIAQEIYGAEDITADKAVQRPLRRAREGRFRQVPDLRGQDPIQLHHQSRRQGRRRSGFTIPIREVRLSAGAEFVVGDLRRHHDHAGPAESAGRQQYRACPGRPHHRFILDVRKGVARGLTRTLTPFPREFRPADHSGKQYLRGKVRWLEHESRGAISCSCRDRPMCPTASLRAMHVAMEDHRSSDFPKLTLPLLRGAEEGLQDQRRPGRHLSFERHRRLGSRAHQYAFARRQDARRPLRPVQPSVDRARPAATASRSIVQEEEWGTGANPDRIEEALRADKSHEIKGVHGGAQRDRHRRHQQCRRRAPRHGRRQAPGAALCRRRELDREHRLPLWTSGASTSPSPARRRA